LQEVGVVPDLAFGLVLPGGSRRNFMVEIDRGTMPVVRANFLQTSFERKMRAYLTAHAAKAHEHRFGWNTFRVLTVTTDEPRLHSMQQALRELQVPHSAGTSLFFFTTRELLCGTPDGLMHAWRDGSGRDVRLV
jgi:hypothetical protein